MNVQLLADNQELIQPIRDFFHRKGGTVFLETNVERFFNSSIKNPSNVFIIQSDINPLPHVLDTIKDVRTFFGAFPFIFIIGKKSASLNTTIFLNIGADTVFTFPYDLTILEDFLGKNLQRDSFLPLKYRNIPSGGSHVTLTRQITLFEINSEGICFTSKDFITRGTIFDFNIKKFIDIPIALDTIECRLISSESNNDDEEDEFTYFAEYHEIEPEIKKQIRFTLKNS